jgi:SAM-dependent methyltransferase
MDDVSKALKDHYESAFKVHGASSKGVDWGPVEGNVNLRYEKMLALLTDSEISPSTSLLDVGCGFGGLLGYSRGKGLNFSYTGVDVAENMIYWAKKEYPADQFVLGDFLEIDFDKKFSYVVCNGILTQKLNTPGLLMDEYAHKLIRSMYDLCSGGIAFNVMTTKVNYFANNLYYRNPAELLSWCMSEITRHVKLDHAYPLFEYTLYLYREVRV